MAGRPAARVGPDPSAVGAQAPPPRLSIVGSLEGHRDLANWVKNESKGHMNHAVGGESTVDAVDLDRRRSFLVCVRARAAVKLLAAEVEQGA